MWEDRSWKECPNWKTKNNLPAYNRKCRYCNRLHHTEDDCRTKERAKSSGKDESNSLWQPVRTGKSKDRSLKYFLGSQSIQWHQQLLSSPTLQTTAIYQAFRYTPPRRLQGPWIPTCKSLISNHSEGHGRYRLPELPYGLQHCPQTWHPKKQLNTCHNADAHSQQRQIKLFISWEACLKLGIIPSSFPTLSEAFKPDSCSNVDENPIPRSRSPLANSAQTNCKCPRHQLPPAKPSKLSFPATENNWENLQNWLLSKFESSSFNTCPHQPLPMMEGPPLCLMIDPNAKPVAFHTPVPVPLHWQEDVKAGLDQDVQLSVIEPVSVGDLVTSCHRMVICAKKNGKPHRTVDLQPFNSHVKKETHHTISFPPSQTRTTENQEDNIRLLEWLPQRATTLWWQALHHIYHSLGKIPIQGCSSRVHCIRWHIHQAVQRDRCRHPQQNKMHRWRSPMVQRPWKLLLASNWMAWHLDSVCLARKYLDAIQNFLRPCNITDIRSWFGLTTR